MDRNPDPGVSGETSRLLAELDRAISRSDAVRDIVRRWQLLHDMERVIGPSRMTRVLHKQIMLLERRIHAHSVNPGSAGTAASKKQA